MDPRVRHGNRALRVTCRATNAPRRRDVDAIARLLVCHTGSPPMPHIPSSEIHGLIVRARMALGLTQKELAQMFGASLRTASRWESGRSHPDLEQLRELARAVHGKDAALAEAIVLETGTTLEALGLRIPANAAPLPPARAFPPIALLADSVILAAVDAAATHADSPLQERPAILDVLRAAVARARALGLTIEELGDALASCTGPRTTTPSNEKPVRWGPRLSRPA